MHWSITRIGIPNSRHLPTCIVGPCSRAFKGDLTCIDVQHYLSSKDLSRGGQAWKSGELSLHSRCQSDSKKTMDKSWTGMWNSLQGKVLQNGNLTHRAPKQTICLRPRKTWPCMHRLGLPSRWHKKIYKKPISSTIKWYFHFLLCLATRI